MFALELYLNFYHLILNILESLSVMSYICMFVCVCVFVFCVWMGVILCLNLLKNNLVDKNIILFILCVWKRNKYEKLYILAKHYITKLFTYTYTSYNIAIYN